MELCLATRNPSKLKEIGEMLAADERSRAITLRMVTDFSDAEPVEDGGTYLANATIKAKAALAASGLPSLADDAGLEVDALPGEFGVESAPYVASLGGWPVAIEAIAKRIAEGAPDTARHRVTFVLCTPDGQTQTTTATIHGRLVYPGRGSDWGFNNYFLPDGSDLTYSEIINRFGMPTKNAASARGHALSAMIEKLAGLASDLK